MAPCVCLPNVGPPAASPCSPQRSCPRQPLLDLIPPLIPLSPSPHQLPCSFPLAFLGPWTVSPSPRASPHLYLRLWHDLPFPAASGCCSQAIGPSGFHPNCALPRPCAPSLCSACPSLGMLPREVRVLEAGTPAPPAIPHSTALLPLPLVPAFLDLFSLHIFTRSSL